MWNCSRQVFCFVSLLLTFTCVEVVKAQQIKINSKSYNIRQRSMIPCNLKDGSILDISFKDIDLNTIQVGPFTGKNSASLKVTYRDGNSLRDSLILRYQHPYISSKNIKVQINGSIDQIILELFGGKSSYMITLIKNQWDWNRSL